jgi:hypothetical protein
MKSSILVAVIVFACLLTSCASGWQRHEAKLVPTHAENQDASLPMVGLAEAIKFFESELGAPNLVKYQVPRELLRPLLPMLPANLQRRLIGAAQETMPGVPDDFVWTVQVAHVSETDMGADVYVVFSYPGSFTDIKVTFQKSDGRWKFHHASRHGES